MDVVLRPEDIVVFENPSNGMLCGKIQSVVFKGVHYELTVLTEDGYELLVHDYNCFNVGATVGLAVKPFDIHVMKKVPVHPQSSPHSEYCWHR